MTRSVVSSIRLRMGALKWSNWEIQHPDRPVAEGQTETQDVTSIALPWSVAKSSREVPGGLEVEDLEHEEQQGEGQATNLV